MRMTQHAQARVRERVMQDGSNLRNILALIISACENGVSDSDPFQRKTRVEVAGKSLIAVTRNGHVITVMLDSEDK